MGNDVRRFTINVPETILDDLRDRLSRTRFPDEINDDDWSYGTRLTYLKELCEYWRECFNWRDQEAELNRLPQFITEIEGLRVHFIHVPSKEPAALPLIITHGWPGTAFEFIKIIPALTDPVAHGGSPHDAFHVVCPSMPGYGFSQAPKKPGMGLQQIARIEAELMARLGYHRYGAQGGDWGSMVSTLLGVLDQSHCVGVHLNLVMAGPPEDEKNSLEGLTAQELFHLEENKKFEREEMGYFHIQSTKPQTIGYSLNDSPAGLAAWIIEKYRTWSDCHGDLESKFGKDELLTIITLYWVTGSITSSIRLYREALQELWSIKFGKVPTGVCLFPKELFKPPRRWVEKRYNLYQWTEMPSGGHFAALEEPNLLVEDIRKFFRKVR